MRKTYDSIAIDAIKTATTLDAQQCALDVLAIAEKSAIHRRQAELDEMFRKIRRSVQTAL